MGADGGFEVAKIKDMKLTKITLSNLRVGQASGGTGIVKLFGFDVYLATYGTNFYGPSFGILPGYLTSGGSLDESPEYLDYPEYLATLLTVETLRKLLDIEDWYFDDNTIHSMVENLNKAGIHTIKDLYNAWGRALDWSSYESFETWT